MVALPKIRGGLRVACRRHSDAQPKGAIQVSLFFNFSGKTHLMLKPEAWVSDSLTRATPLRHAVNAVTLSAAIVRLSLNFGVNSVDMNAMRIIMQR